MTWFPLISKPQNPSANKSYFFFPLYHVSVTDHKVENNDPPTSAAMDSGFILVACNFWAGEGGNYNFWENFLKNEEHRPTITFINDSLI